eukprot:gene7009-1252_t
MLVVACSLSRPLTDPVPPAVAAAALKPPRWHRGRALVPGRVPLDALNNYPAGPALCLLTHLPSLSPALALLPNPCLAINTCGSVAPPLSSALDHTQEGYRGFDSSGVYRNLDSYWPLDVERRVEHPGLGLVSAAVHIPGLRDHPQFADYVIEDFFGLTEQVALQPCTPPHLLRRLRLCLLLSLSVSA